MRLRERHVRRRNNDEQIIDLDHIFHEEDPLNQWIREKEDRVLDDRDNEWLDDALMEEEHQERHPTTAPRPRQDDKYKLTYQKKKKPITSQSGSSSND